MEATKEINWLVAEVISPFMKKNGFKRRRLAFSRPFQHGFDVLVLQKSSWNGATDARFTFNLGIYWSKAEEMNGTGVSGAPFSDSHCTVWERIGFLIQPPADKWWVISSPHHVLDLPDEIISAIGTYALPWFQAGHDIDTSLLVASKHHHTEKIRALKWLKDEWIG
jgi:hypothetical protein